MYTCMYMYTYMYHLDDSFLPSPLMNSYTKIKSIPICNTREGKNFMYYKSMHQ